MAVPTKTKKTSNRNKTVISREVIGIGREMTENYLSFVYNTKSCIFIFNNNSSLEIYHISHSMIPNQKIKDTPNILLKI